MTSVVGGSVQSASTYAYDALGRGELCDSGSHHGDHNFLESNIDRSFPARADICRRRARSALVGRDQDIEGELKRLTELQAEKERVRRELDAVNAALEVFGDIG